MSNAAWETALRHYLEVVAVKRDPVYKLLAGSMGIPRLYNYAKVARGGRVFHDEPRNDGNAQLIERLPKLRNQLLHLGKRDLTEDVARNSALAVLRGIDWLFRDA
jgi:hypothetical protein